MAHRRVSALIFSRPSGAGFDVLFGNSISSIRSECWYLAEAPGRIILSSAWSCRLWQGSSNKSEYHYRRILRGPPAWESAMCAVCTRWCQAVGGKVAISWHDKPCMDVTWAARDHVLISWIRFRVIGASTKEEGHAEDHHHHRYDHHDHLLLPTASIFPALDTIEPLKTLCRDPSLLSSSTF